MRVSFSHRRSHLLLRAFFLCLLPVIAFHTRHIFCVVRESTSYTRTHYTRVLSPLPRFSLSRRNLCDGKERQQQKRESADVCVPCSVCFDYDACYPGGEPSASLLSLCMTVYTTHTSTTYHYRIATSQTGACSLEGAKYIHDHKTFGCYKYITHPSRYDGTMQTSPRTQRAAAYTHGTP